MRACATILFGVPALLLANPVFAQPPTTPAALWHDRGDAAALDLVGGPGGSAHEPGVDFRFIKESRSGTSPKFDVEDEHGVTWKVKLGEEARSESAATRLIWAAGYLVDETYYRPQIQVRGLEHLVRGRQFVSGSDTVSGARLERGGGVEAGPWSWYDNPFVGTREFNGLRVMMALVNNWDLKDINNGGADDARGGEQYGVTDLGATFGRTGNTLVRSKGVPKDYVAARFIEKVTRTHVDFRIRSRPFFLSIFNLGYYRSRTRMESIGKQVPIADARWLGGRLGRLSAGQVGDCFRASGFGPADVEAYTRVVMQRIASLQALTAPTADADDAGGSAPAAPDADATRCLVSTCRQVPVRERLTAFPLGTPFAQAVVGGFEQGAGFGGGVRLTSANALPAVQLRATALTSLQLYRRVDLEAVLPNIGGSRNHANIWFTYLERDTAFFGIGPQATADPRTGFAITRRSYQASLVRDFADDVQGGAYVQVMQARASPVQDTTVAPINEGYSGSPTEAASRWLPGLSSDTRVLKYGAFLALDTRDNSRGLTRGLNIYARVASADSVGAPHAVTRYGWAEGDIDLRGYIPLGSHKTSLLLRSRGQVKTPHGGRKIPFYDLSWLGGREYVRGYHSYRYRGNNAVLLSTELQQTMRAFSDMRGVDVFGFADTGQVWGDDRSATDRLVLANALFDRGHWHPGFGGGLQYRHSRNLAGRIELGHSREGTVAYFSLTRGL